MSLGDGETSKNRAALRAMAHPIRLRIMSLLTGAPLTAAEVARELGISHANASYHLRNLLTGGLIVPAGEEKIRGGVARRYRHPWDEPRPVGPEPTTEDTEQHVAALASELVRRYALRQPSARSVTTDADLWVAPETWDEVVALVTQASHLLHQEARPPRSPGTLRVNLTTAAFSMSDRRPHEPASAPAPPASSPGADS
jgi:DNA-binding transcriptional ArsR family regulator